MLYLKITDALKSEIIDGILKEGDKLPSEISLAKRFETTKSTVRKSLKILVDQGYVHVINQSGYYVNTIEVIRSFNALNLQSLAETHKNDKLENKVLFFEELPAPEEIAEKLNIDVFEKVYFGIRIRFVNDVPIQMECTYLPCYLFPDLDDVIFSKSLYDYVEEEYKISYSIKNISAGTIPLAFEKYIPSFAKQPLLIVDNTSRLRDGRVFEYSQNYHLEQSFTLISHRN